MTDLVISIGTLDNYETLERCLLSIYEEDSPSLSYQVWVVYNGSGDHKVTAEIERNFPQVTLITKQGPLGYCATHNLVLSQAKGRYILILDDDTVVRKGTLSRMVAFMDANPSVGIAGCKTLNPDGTFQKTYGLLPTLKTELINAFLPDAFWSERLYQDTSSVRTVEWLNGSFMLVRYEVIKEVGLLDEHFYTFVCEPDWCYRIRKAGWQVMYVPDAEITHVGGEHSINNKYSATNYTNLVRYHVNRYYFFRKHCTGLVCALLRPIMMLGVVSRMVYYSFFYLVNPDGRLVARVRLKTFWKVLKLSFSLEPYNFPEELQRDVSTSAALKWVGK